VKEQNFQPSASCLGSVFSGFSFVGEYPVGVNLWKAEQSNGEQNPGDAYFPRSAPFAAFVESNLSSLATKLVALGRKRFI